MAVGSENHEVFDVRAVELDPSVNEIVERHCAYGYAYADGARHARGFTSLDFCRGQMAARSIVPPRAAGALGGLALCVQFLSGAIAVVGAARRNQLLRHAAIATETLGLKVRSVGTADVRPFVPRQ